MAIYYVNNTIETSNGTGLSPETPVRSYRELSLKPGDTILFKRGCIFRDSIDSPNGKPVQKITWDAYGEGNNPKFLGSVNISDSRDWCMISEHVWEYQKPLPAEVCNLIFNNNDFQIKKASWGNLCWEYEEMKKQGDWYYTHLGCTNRPCPEELLDAPRKLFLYSIDNPGKVYSDIECVLFHSRSNSRSLASAQKHVTFRNLDFFYGLHGFLGIDTTDIMIQQCGFYFLGGAVWQKDRKIRFGNGTEFWKSANYITVEHCIFDQIYDSCFTTQGGGVYQTPSHIRFANNTCSNYGMAAYELRDKITLDTFFEHNKCSHAGEGFSLQNDIRPRNSEIYPEPMGHHIYVWRISEATPGGKVVIRNNKFDKTFHGFCLYTTRIETEPSKQLIMDENVITTYESTEKQG